MKRAKVDQPERNLEQTDQAEIDRIAQVFFAAFSNRGGRTPRLDELRQLFVDNAVIVKRTNGSVEVMTVDAFIAPRQTLLSSGTLTEFWEWEQDSETKIVGGLACRWSTYGKSGLMHGAPYQGIGKKIFSFVRSGNDWKIVSAIWEDRD